LDDLPGAVEYFLVAKGIPEKFPFGGWPDSPRIGINNPLRIIHQE
jgi:hypothetical protein